MADHNFDDLPDAAHVSAAVLAELFGCDTSTVWRRARSGHLPRPIRFSSRSTRWNVGQVRQAVARAAEETQ